MIYLVRHGRTDWNVARKVQGRTDIPLNDEGISQALSTREKLSGVKFDAVFASPLIRARETARLISGIEPTTDERIIERDFGDAEGSVVADATKHWGFWEYATRKEKVLNGESLQETFDRANDFLTEIMRKYRGKNVLIVSHGGTLRALLAYFGGVPEDGDFFGSYKAKNCEIFKFANE
ncbi:MAG: histidine phosphatase family protein [Christensenellaceae bacterium]|jgi:broad specificity phosphatase PhoE|nr:histidine phosphatase family protein [Christensenellaceae bacterium]